MHVHANYNLQLASLGVSRSETQEMLARRAAEVRKKLATARGAILGGVSETGDEVLAVESRGENHRELPPDGHREDRQPQESDEGEFGRLFSALA